MKPNLIKLQSAPVIIAATIIILMALMHAQSVVNPLLMAMFISIICAQPISWLRKKNVPQGYAVLIVLLGILAVYVAFIQLIGSSVSMFMADAPKYQQSLKGISDSAITLLADRGINIPLLGGKGITDPAKIMQQTATLFGKLGDVLNAEFTFLFLTIFLLAEIEGIFVKFEVIAKNNNLKPDYFQNIGKSIRHYLSIKTTTSLVTGILVGISLAIIGVDYPILWGLVAFLLNFIPTIGSIIAAVPAVILSMVQLGYPETLFTIGVYVAVNVIIGNVIEPKIMGKGLGLSTFIVFFGLIFWGFILGPVGMFLSVPLMMVIKIILENNPNSAWAAAMLGTQSEAEACLKEE